MQAASTAALRRHGPPSEPTRSGRPRSPAGPSALRFLSTGALVLFLLAWEAAADSGVVDPLFISSPSRIAMVGWQLAGDEAFWRDLRVSSTEFFSGYAVAVLVGIPLGLAIAGSRRMQYLVGPFVDVLNVVPRISFLPILVIWFGIGLWSKFAVVLMGAVIPIVISTQTGAKTSEARFMKVARSFNASKLKLLTSIILPGTVPFIFTGLKYGAGRALLGVVVGELYAATAGIGHMIADAGNTFDTDTLFFGVLLFTGTGLLITAALDRLEHRFERWRPAPGGGA